MSGQTEQHELEQLRAQLDQIDARLIHNLNLRAALSKQVGELKAKTGSAIFRPDREAALLDRALHLSEQAGAILPEQHLLAIYREILSSSRALQGKLSVACLGPQGSSSYLAAREYFGDSQELTLHPDLAALFAAVQNQTCALGLAPLDSSQQNEAGQILDLFASHDLQIQAEWQSRNPGKTSTAWTRFLIIGLQALPGFGPRKSSIIFNLADQPEALAKLREILTPEQIKLTSLASGSQNSLRFADLDCDLSAPQYQDLRQSLAQACVSFRFLGAYAPGRPFHAAG